MGRKTKRVRKSLQAGKEGKEDRDGLEHHYRQGKKGIKTKVYTITTGRGRGEGRPRRSRPSLLAGKEGNKDQEGLDHHYRQGTKGIKTKV